MCATFKKVAWMIAWWGRRWRVIKHRYSWSEFTGLGCGSCLINVWMCYFIRNKIVEFLNLYHSVTKFFKSESNVHHFLQLSYLGDFFFFFNLASVWALIYFMEPSWFSTATEQLLSVLWSHKLKKYYYTVSFLQIHI